MTRYLIVIAGPVGCPVVILDACSFLIAGFPTTQAMRQSQWGTAELDTINLVPDFQ